VEFLTEYAVFLAKALTIALAIIAVLVVIAVLRRGQDKHSSGHLEVRKLNAFYHDLQEQLEQALLSKEALKQLRKRTKAQEKAAKQSPAKDKPRVFVLDFEGDLRASAVSSLRQSVTALLGMATAADEVVVRLESAGGMVHAYGLAASQLVRVRQAGIPLTICVDKVAASGGYMMACIGQKILAAPFSILGSIGVVAQLPNLHRLLKKHDVDYEILTAGEYKRTLTVFGENTPKGREKFQEDLETTHQLFKDFVASYRPALSMDEVATGEIWLGTSALAKGLVDELMTSDEYLAKRAREAELFQLAFVEKKGLSERLGGILGSTLEQGLLRVWTRLNEQRFWQ